MAEQQKAIDKRKSDLEHRDQERRDMMHKKHIERQKYAQEKRYKTEKKIEKAKMNADEVLDK